MTSKQNKNQQNKPTAVVTKVVVEEKKENPKTARNRAKRERQKAKRQTSTNQSSVAKGLMGELIGREIDLELSIKQQLQTLFAPSYGLHRPFKEGFDSTALIGWKGSANFTGLDTTNTFLNLMFRPSTPAGIIIRQLNSTGIADPSTGGSTSGPFAAINPSVAFRVISAEFTVSFTTPLLNMSGGGEVFYVPNSTTFGWTRSEIDQLEWTAPINASNKIVLHWVPNEVETQFIPYNGAYANNSMLGLWLNVPTSQATSFAVKIDWLLGIEYVPNSAYRPYVSRTLHSALPETRYYVSKAIRKYWNPWVLNPKGETGLMDQGIGGHSVFETHTVAGDVDDDVEEILEEEKRESGGNVLGTLATAGLESAMTGSPLPFIKEGLTALLSPSKTGKGRGGH